MTASALEFCPLTPPETLMMGGGPVNPGFWAGPCGCPPDVTVTLAAAVPAPIPLLPVVGALLAETLPLLDVTIAPPQYPLMFGGVRLSATSAYVPVDPPKFPPPGAMELAGDDTTGTVLLSVVISLLEMRVQCNY